MSFQSKYIKEHNNTVARALQPKQNIKCVNVFSDNRGRTEQMWRAFQGDL